MIIYTPLELVQGTNYSNSITVTNSDGSAFDLTNYEVRGQIKRFYGDSVFATGFSFTFPNRSGGLISLTLSPSGTSSLDCGQYWYDIEIYTSGNATVTPLAQGQLNVYPQM